MVTASVQATTTITAVGTLNFNSNDQSSDWEEQHHELVGYFQCICCISSVLVYAICKIDISYNWICLVLLTHQVGPGILWRIYIYGFGFLNLQEGVHCFMSWLIRLLDQHLEPGEQVWVNKGIVHDGLIMNRGENEFSLYGALLIEGWKSAWRDMLENKV